MQKFKLLEAPKAQKIQHKVKFGLVQGENRGKPEELMNPPIEVIDNYYWMRDDTRTNQQVLDYIEKENNYFNNNFTIKKEIAKNLYNELKEYLQEDYSTCKFQLYPNSNYEYFYKYIGSNPFVQHCRFNKETGQDEILLDENELEIKGKELDITNFKINPTELIMSYGIDYEGNELYELRIVNIKNKKILGSIKDLVYCGYVWVNSNTIYYLKGNESNRLLYLYVYCVDTNQSKLIYTEDNFDLNLSIGLSSDKKYLIITSSNYNQNEVRFIDIDVDKESINKLLDLKSDTFYNVDHAENYFYVYTNDNAKNWKIMRMKDNTFQLEEFIPMNPHIYINSFTCFKEYLVYEIKINGTNFIIVTTYEKTKTKIINNVVNISMDFDEFISTDYSDYKIDYIYSIELESNYLYDTKFLHIKFDTMTNPTRIYEYNLDNIEFKMLWEKPVPNYDSSKYFSERHWVPINDPKWPLGIPISIVYNKEIYLQNGTKPAYLYGYGSYGITVEPKFDFKIVPLLDRGWIYVIAHVRGSSFVNYEWYEDGKMFNKLNTFNDFIAVGEYLKQENFCNEITIEGRSAGGLLVGASMVLKPDLFTNVIAGVPFVDVLNTMSDSTIPLTVEEWTQWGNPNSRESFDYIKKYCPYTNITKTNYPNLFITCGLYDPRVQYWEPLKFIAKIRECKTDSNTQIIKISMGQGHFGGSSRYKYLEEIAEKYAFILDK